MASILPYATGFPPRSFPAPSSVALELLCRTRDEVASRRTRAALENPDRWLFLDTETTGLAGGTGTYAFLIGLAWWDAGGLQVEQLFLRDFSEEYSLLHELAARIAERPVLVTFNGKTFDWPLLESRFTMTRSIKVPQLAAHSSFASSRPRALEASPRLCPPRGTRALRPGCLAPWLEPRRRSDLLFDSATLF